MILNIFIESSIFLNNIDELIGECDMVKFSTGKVAAFYTADQHERQSIRQDVLAERYVDLQLEMENIENLLNISEQERNEILFDINEMLFEYLESLVPEVFQDSNPLQEAEDVRQVTAKRMKDREKVAIEMRKRADSLKQARGDIESARIKMQSSESPETKLKARESLRMARKNLSRLSVKKES